MPKLRLLLSLVTKNNDYQVEQAAAAQATAQNLDVDLQLIYAESDTITQSTQLLRVIQSDPSLRPDAILFEPVGGTALPQVGRAAVSAGIAWCVLNNDAEYIPDLRREAKVPVFSVSSDHREIGRIQARQYSALIPRGGSVLYIQGPSDNIAAKGRVAGMHSSLPTNIHVNVLRGQWTEESAVRSVSSWLKLTVANKARIDVIGAQNDAMAMGARKVFESLPDSDERDRWLALPFLGVDGLPKTGQAWVRNGSLAATIVIPPNAPLGVELMHRALQNGIKPPERSFTEPESFPPLERLAPQPQTAS